MLPSAVLKRASLDVAMDEASALIHGAKHIKTRIMARKIRRMLRKIHHCIYKKRDHALLDQQVKDMAVALVGTLGEYMKFYDSLHALSLNQRIDTMRGFDAGLTEADLYY
jgi:hypothetical protein